jgi:hypothetical protein
MTKPQAEELLKDLAEQKRVLEARIDATNLSLTSVATKIRKLKEKYEIDPPPAN